ncbi:MAG: 5-formyltetrahydrofolate cyclo-ligase [Parachlamydiales bacterium]|nr:5-formyltetrahydrofolate cyclo-ligase [Parachlamydiales bacterium]
MIQKSELRKLLLEKRKAIPQKRRIEAAKLALESFKEAGRILSFSPFGSEIDLTLLNEHLKAQNRLYLVPYEFEALIHVPFSEIDCILVPGLAFDRKHFRLGYGKGFYDRFLATVPDIMTIGVGFKEQFYEGILPIDTWDIPVKEIRLF